MIRTPSLAAGRLLVYGIGAVLLAPALVLIWSLLTSDYGSSWSHVVEYLLKPAFLNSLVLVLGVGIVSLCLGVPAAWCVSRYHFAGRRLFSILLILPLAVPPYIASYTTTELREAMLPLLISIREQHGVDTYLAFERIHRYAWLILSLSAVLFPYVYLSCRAVISSRSNHLGEASLLLGVSRIRSLWTLHLPLLRPALVAGLFLVTMEVLSDYGAAKYFGVQTLTVTVFRIWFSLDELNTARYLASLVFVIILFLFFFERWQRGGARFEDFKLKESQLREIPVHKKWMCWFFCGMPILLGFITPVFYLTNWLLTSKAKTRLADYGAEAFNTVWMGLLVTTLCIGVCILYITVSRFSNGKKEQGLTTTLFTSGYATTGTVLAIGVLAIGHFMRSIVPADHFLRTLVLSSSYIWLIYALVVRYMTVSGNVLSASYRSIPKSYDAAAQSLGRKMHTILLTIHLPLVKSALFAGAALVFVDVIKELPLTLLLRPFNFETLGTQAYSMVNQGLIFECAFPSLLLILVSAAVLLLVEAVNWKKK